MGDMIDKYTKPTGGCIKCAKCTHVRTSSFCGNTKLTNRQLYNEKGYCSEFVPKCGDGMRTIDADALIEKCGEWYVEEGPEDGFIGTIKQLIDTQPTIQSDIIRCKDCAYCDSDVVNAPYGMTKKIFWCDRLYAGVNENLIVEPDDFCSWAERREGGH